jgi:hypothetical protein
MRVYVSVKQLREDCCVVTEVENGKELRYFSEKRGLGWLPGDFRLKP